MPRASSNIIAIPELNGRELPRVTHIIDMLHKPWFAPWGAKLAAQYTVDKIKAWATELRDGWITPEELAVKISKIDTDKLFTDAKKEHKRKGKEAADLGTRTHEAIERWIRAQDGEQFDIDRDLEKPFNAFLEWWNDNRIQVILTEYRLWSLDGGGWTGRIDVLCYVADVLGIWDFKTSKEIYDEHILQNAAYFTGLKQKAGEMDIPPPEIGGVLRLDKEDGYPHPHVFKEEELQMVYPAFVSLTQSWWQMRAFKKFLRERKKSLTQML